MSFERERPDRIPDLESRAPAAFDTLRTNILFLGEYRSDPADFDLIFTGTPLPRRPHSPVWKCDIAPHVIMPAVKGEIVRKVVSPIDLLVNRTREHKAEKSRQMWEMEQTDQAAITYVTLTTEAKARLAEHRMVRGLPRNLYEDGIRTNRISSKLLEAHVIKTALLTGQADFTILPTGSLIVSTKEGYEDRT